MPVVTVLMTVYNGGGYLRDSVKSVLNQTYKDFEFLIVNDCSTDGSVRVIESFNDSRVVVHNNVRNIGQTRSLNAGLRLAKGRYVARMDADDMAYPLWLEKTAAFLGKNPGYAAVGVAAAAMNASGKIKRLLRPPAPFPEFVFHMFFGNAINHVGSLLDKEAVLEAGGYDEEFRVSQDFELWGSLIRKGRRITNLPHILAAVRVHDNSLGYVEEKRTGLVEVAETIRRNAGTLTDLAISHELALRLRLFYRFPEDLGREEFYAAHLLLERILSGIKGEFAMPRLRLRAKMRAQMLIPFCKRARFEIRNNDLKAAREVILSYKSAYGVHWMTSVIFLMTFLGRRVAGRLPYMHEKLSEKAVRAITAGGQ